MGSTDQGTLLLKKQLRGRHSCFTFWRSLLRQTKLVPVLLGELPTRVLSFNPISTVVLVLELSRKGTEGFSAGLIDDDDMFKWEVTIFGPPDTF